MSQKSCRREMQELCQLVVLCLLLFSMSGCRTNTPAYTLKPWDQTTVSTTKPTILVGQVRAAIRKNPSLSPYLLYIGVAEKNGSVIITGALPSEQLKDSLITSVATIVRSDQIVDQLKVANEPGRR
jgi:hypothetical protein